jgi:uncharacterized membrane protein
MGNIVIVSGYCCYYIMIQQYNQNVLGQCLVELTDKYNIYEQLVDLTVINDGCLGRF